MECKPFGFLDYRPDMIENRKPINQYHTLLNIFQSLSKRKEESHGIQQNSNSVTKAIACPRHSQKHDVRLNMYIKLKLIQ